MGNPEGPHMWNVRLIDLTETFLKVRASIFLCKSHLQNYRYAWLYSSYTHALRLWWSSASCYYTDGCSGFEIQHDIWSGSAWLVYLFSILHASRHLWFSVYHAMVSNGCQRMPRSDAIGQNYGYLLRKLSLAWSATSTYWQFPFCKSQGCASQLCRKLA